MYDEYASDEYVKSSSMPLISMNLVKLKEDKVDEISLANHTAHFKACQL
jgi:hypothetical protein